MRVINRSIYAIGHLSTVFIILGLGVVALIFNPSTRGTKAGGALSLSPVWFMERVATQGYPEKNKN